MIIQLNYPCKNKSMEQGRDMVNQLKIQERKRAMNHTYKWRKKLDKVVRTIDNFNSLHNTKN